MSFGHRSRACGGSFVAILMAGAATAALLLCLAIYGAELSKSLHASHERLKWSFDVLANDRAISDMRTGEEAAQARHDRFIDNEIDIWLDRETNSYRI